MIKYKIILCFADKREISSVLFDEKPTEQKVQEAMKFYNANSHRIEEVDSN